MRCDLHVHTKHSGMCTVPLLDKVCRESYNDPQEVYERLKHREMDLVTITDHDSIDAAESLLHKPDFFLSEEVSATTPSGNGVHIGVYGINERQHQHLQSRRADFHSLIAYLQEQDLLFSVNHVFSGLTGRRSHDDFSLFATLVPAVETLNGQIPRALNQSAAAFAAQWRKTVVGGSDAHTMHGLGRTYTEVRGATSAKEFLARLKAGHGFAGGDHGSYWKLTRAIAGIGCSMSRENRWTTFLAPLIMTVPLITTINLVSELSFNYKWTRRVHRLTANNFIFGNQPVMKP